MIKLLFLGLTICCVGHASDLESRIKQLELKVQRLDRGMNSRPVVKDLNHKKLNATSPQRSLSSKNQLTEDQQKEIQKALEQYKKNQQESQKLLDELMAEP